ncbi:hypothetical protein R3W88_011104 [Solanum pinnatisectum]|uniref:N-acetyltransferase domain-containing protein n=1 Tax=Solanum pinnatisectum TaxID=50273 RepID=A0AAV9L5L2_9SOLN|nr:hypothetical protein R3W88_011104 [Solanum pinnatisectum]
MESSRISVRPFRLTDVDDILLWASDKRVTRTIRWDTLTTKEEVLSFIKEVCIPQPWHVSICIDDRSIGFLWVFHPAMPDDFPEEDIEVAEIGYAIGAEYWGQGIATKALKMAIPQVFNDFPQIVKIIAYAILENKASHRVLEKAGFHYERSLTLRGDFKEYGNKVDLVVYNFTIII